MSLQIITVGTLLMDTLVKRTPRVGPYLSLLPLFDSLKDGHLATTDTWCLSLQCPFLKRVDYM